MVQINYELENGVQESVTDAADRAMEFVELDYVLDEALCDQ